MSHDESKLDGPGTPRGASIGPSSNPLVTPLLTDLYQVTMAYAYWKAGRHNEHAVFDMFFRKNPFKGEYTIFSGLEEVVKYVAHFKFTREQVNYVKTVLPEADEGFFTYLAELDGSGVCVEGVAEGTVVFPRTPLLKISGDLGVCQLLETTILCLCNYASLMTTNAARFRKAAGDDKTLLEFGLRRAQGPDGAMSASRYAYMGGFDGTSNVAAGLAFGISVSGTHAHSFVSSYTGFQDLSTNEIVPADGGDPVDFVALVRKYGSRIDLSLANESELAAFVAYAQAFPKNFLALVDTYDTLASGVPNFLAVALALHELGYKARGIRLDSGDLAYLSKEARKAFISVSESFSIGYLRNLTIVASNDINESVLHSLAAQKHEIDAFGIGTNLVTCQAQPALGMVYKLVEINGKPRIKLSQELVKVTIPGNKQVYRLVGAEGIPLLDLMVRAGEECPVAGRRLLSRHPFDEKKRVYVTPKTVIPLLNYIWVGAKEAAHINKTRGTNLRPGLQVDLPSLAAIRTRCMRQMENIREDHIRHLNPSPYKVSVTDALYVFIHKLWMEEAPIPEIS